MEFLPIAALNELVFKQLDAPSLGRLQCVFSKTPEHKVLLDSLLKQRMQETVAKTLDHAAAAIMALVEHWFCHRVHLETMMNVYIGTHVVRGSIRLPSGFFFQIRDMTTASNVIDIAADTPDRPAMLAAIMEVLRKEIAPDTLPYAGTMAQFKQAFCARWIRLVDHPIHPLVDYRFLDLPGNLSTRPLLLRALPLGLLAEDCSPLQWSVPALFKSSLAFSLSTYPPQWHQVIQIQMAAAEELGWTLLGLCHAPVFA